MKTLYEEHSSNAFWKNFHEKVVWWYQKNTAQKMKFSIKDSFSKFDQIRSNLRIWSNLLKKSLMENFIFCVVEGALSSQK